jgi:hypothetical protein
MVRRGSTVRVRQRALKSLEIAIFVVSIDTIEHLLFKEGIDASMNSLGISEAA